MHLHTDPGETTDTDTRRAAGRAFGLHGMKKKKCRRNIAILIITVNTLKILQMRVQPGRERGLQRGNPRRLCVSSLMSTNTSETALITHSLCELESRTRIWSESMFWQLHLQSVRPNALDYTRIPFRHHHHSYSHIHPRPHPLHALVFDILANGGNPTCR